MTPSSDDPQAAELLAHAAWIRRLALGLVGQPALADDLVQDTWLAALRRPPSAERPLRPWLGTVLRNAARQAFRGSGRRARREAEARPAEPVPGPEELAERLELERALTDELARLAEPFRSTLMLRFYGGLEPSEIARRQDLPAGSVRWRVKRGLDLLRERLDARFGGRPQWSVLFLSFARPFGAPLTGAAAVALPGVLAMHAFTKLGIGAAAAVALAFGLRLGGVWPDALWPLPHEEPARVSIRPLVPEVPAEPRLAAQPVIAAERQALPVLVAERKAAEPEPTALPAAAVAARVVDELGAPISGARLRVVDADDEATSNVEGELRLELALPSERRAFVFALSARGFGSLGVEAVVSAGSPTHLGTLVLLYGGVVSGFVRSQDGLPLVDAQVTFTGTDLPRNELERERLQPASSRVPEGRTRADGSFTVEGVRAGHVRAWAHAPGHLASYSAPLEVRAGHESYGLELVLEPVPPANHVAGVVLDPDGHAVASALLDYRHSSSRSGVTTTGDKHADADGRFTFLLPDDAELWITARDPEQRFGPASASEVRTGTGELVLQLTRVEGFELRVTGPRSEPVTTYAVDVLSPDQSFQHQRLPRAEREDGRVMLRRPSQPFALRVEAAGYELALTGPLDPAALSELLTVPLVPLPGLRGSVTVDGNPAAGASVSLHPLVSERLKYVKDGFRALVEQAVDTVTTDSEGRFLLTPRKPGRYVVRAERAGRAPAVSATIEIGPTLDGGELALALTPGGAIEGRVVTTDGTDPAGTIVGLSRGDGHDRTLRVGPDGAFRFERLTPGPWLLLQRDEEIRPGSTTTSTSEVRAPLPEPEWTCRVHEGQTTHQDLVLGASDACTLAGRLTIDGRAPGSWSAVLFPEEQFFAADGGKRVPLASDGSFRVGMPEPGRYRLVLAGNSVEGSEQYVLDLVELDWGARDWEFELVTGVLHVTDVPGPSEEGPPSFVHLWDGPGERMAVTIVAGDAAGLVRVSVPAGPGRIARPDPSTLDFALWPTSLELDVPRGGEARASLAP